MNIHIELEYVGGTGATEVLLNAGDQTGIVALSGNVPWAGAADFLKNN